MTRDYATSGSAPNPLPELRPGSWLHDSYHVDGLLGAGVHGAVYRVHHRFLGVQALKLLRPRQGADFERVLSEARILAGLTHPRIVRVFDASVLELPEGAFPYFTMEYLPLGTLADLLQRRIRLSVIEALEIAMQILDGVNTAHSCEPPILHRDLIPGNILLSKAKPLHIKVADFGVASHVHPITGTGHAAGLVDYLPPEAMWGFATLQGDIYAVALILYSMVTGTAAFPTGEIDEGADTLSVILSPRRHPPPPPSRFRQGLSPAMDGLLVTALSPDPSHRFPSAQEFSAAIRAVISIERSRSSE